MASTKKADTKKASPKTTKKAGTKKASAETVGKTAADKTDSKTDATGTDEPLEARAPQALAQQAGYAAAGLVNELVTRTRKVPAQLPTNPEDAAARARQGLDQAAAAFRANFDARVADGRKVTAELLELPRVKQVTTTFEPVLEQAGNTRRQLRAAATSVRKTASEANKAAVEQAGTTVGQFKGAMASVTDIADAAIGAGRRQAGNAKSQVKAAVTSSRKTVDRAVEATRELAG